MATTNPALAQPAAGDPRPRLEAEAQRFLEKPDGYVADFTIETIRSSLSQRLASTWTSAPGQQVGCRDEMTDCLESIRSLVLHRSLPCESPSISLLGYVGECGSIDNSVSRNVRCVSANLLRSSS
jgi:hypothetical protein